MITNITLENFKCFHKVEINPKLVTLFIGPNGTGKSGVLQALLLLKQSKDLRQQLDLDGPLVSVSPYDFKLHGSNQQGGLVHLRVQGNATGNSRTQYHGWPFAVDFRYTDDGDRPSDRYDYVGSFIPQQTLDSLSDVMRDLRAVPAERGLSRQTYPLGRTSHEQITSTAGLGQQEEQVVSTLAYCQADVAEVSDWIEQVTGVGFDTNLVPPQSIKPVSITPTGEVSLVAEGFGTNALVQLLFELARAVEGATILMEEPEIHLHPKAQAELASVIVEEAKASNKQVIMTTHSEHIAGRLLTLVAERKLTPDEVAIYSFEKDPETGICSANEIEVTPRGQVQGGLGAFFEADMDEMRRYVDALRSQE